MLATAPELIFPIRLLFIITFSINIVLGIITLYAYRRILSTRFNFFISLSFFVSSARFLNLLILPGTAFPWTDFIWDITTTMSAMLVFVAALDHVKQRFSNSDISLLFFGYFIFSAALHFFFRDNALQSVSMVLAGIMNIISGIVIWRWPMVANIVTIVQRTIAIVLIIHGLHRLDFPFVQHLAWAMAPGFALNLILTILFAFGVLFHAILTLESRRQLQSEQDQKIYDSAPVGLGLFDTQTLKFASLNPWGESILGYTLEKLNSFHLPDELVHPDDLVKFRELVKNESEESPTNYQLRFKHPEKKWVHLRLVRKVFSTTTTGEPHKIIYGFQDISSFKELQLKLEQTEKIILHSPIVLFRCSTLRPWPVDFVSDNVASIGWQTDDFFLKGNSLSALFDATEIPRFQEKLDAAIAGNKSEFSLELLGHTRTGEIRWFEFTGFPNVRSGFGAPRFECILYDITERKISSLELRESETLLREIFDNTAFGIIVISLETGNVQIANKKFLELTGHDLHDIHDKPLRDLIVKEDLEEFDSILFANTRHNIGKTRISLRISNERDREIWVMLYISQMPEISDSGNRAVLLVEDISVQKKVTDELAETFQRMPSALMIFEKYDSGFILADYNNSAKRILELNVENAIGSNLQDLRFGNGLSTGSSLQKLVETVNEEQAETRLEFSFETEQQTRYVSLVGFLKKDGKIGILGEDITETRSLERDLLEVADNERNQIGQDLHDGLGQQLVGVSMFLNSLLKKVQTEGDETKFGEDIRNLIELVNETNFKMRRFARGLTPLHLQSITLNEVITQNFIDAERLLGIETQMRNRAGEIKLPVAHTKHLFYIIQEFLTNSVKHGKATFIYCELFFEQGRLNIVLYDNGKSEDTMASAGGIGIRTMKYRAQQIGASFELSFGEKGGRLAIGYAPDFMTIPISEKVEVQ